MNSFTIHAVGNLASDPVLAEPASGEPYCKFVLIGNDYAGTDDQGKNKETITSVQFVAFGGIAKTIAKRRKGDQLILESHMRSNRWTDKEGKDRFEMSYIVDGFRFGSPGRETRALMATG